MTALPFSRVTILTPVCRSLLALAFILCAVMPLHAQEAAIASGHPNWPPFSWQEGDKIVGAGSELAEIVFKDVGIPLQIKPMGNWKRVQAETEVGAIDVVVAAYVTEDRKKYLAFPAAPYTVDSNVLWVAKGKTFPFKKWDDLIGKRGTAMLGESYGEKFDQFIKEKLAIDWVTLPVQNYKKLLVGHADYYPFSLYAGQIQIRQLGFEGKIENLPEVVSTEGVYIGISRKSKFLKYLPQLEEAINKRRADGTVDRLISKYIALAAVQK